MKTREFREIQVSSTQLAVIFLGILIIGVVIFLLGVSVGKKHTQVAGEANIIAKKEAEPAKEKITTLPLKLEQEPGQEEAGKQAPAKTEQAPVKKKIVPESSQAAPVKKETRAVSQGTKKKPAEAGPLYYVQVAALAEQPSAQSTAQKFRALGYPVVVFDPKPTDRTPVYRVRVGGVATRAEAEELRAKLAAAAGRKTDYFIVRD